MSRSALRVGLALIAPLACKIPSTLGLPCEVDSHCDAGQFCGDTRMCEEGLPPGPGTSTGPGSSGADSTSFGTADAGDESSTSAGPSSTSTSSADDSTGPACGQAVSKCDKLDVLLVVDNSGSMDEEFAVLLPTFTDLEGFASGLVEGMCSYHIGLTTTEVAPDYQPVECQQRGALNRGGALVSPCFGGEHPPFVTESDNLTQLGCFFAVGQDYDDDEKQVDTALAALSPELAAPGACNEGFLRDDAALVVVFVTDEDDDDDSSTPNEAIDRTGSAGDPGDWFDRLLEIRPAQNVGVVSILANQPRGCAWQPAPDSSDGTGAEFAERILTFMQYFTGVGYGDHVASTNICATAEELMDAVPELLEVIDAVCRDSGL